MFRNNENANASARDSCGDFGNQGRQPHAIGGHAQMQHKGSRQHHVGDIQKQLHQKRQLGLRLTDEPAHHTIIGECNRSRPDPIIEISLTMFADIGRTADEIENQPRG